MNPIQTLQQIVKILGDHPTNVGVGDRADYSWRPLNPGEPGYDRLARWAYLEAKHTLDKQERSS